MILNTPLLSPAANILLILCTFLSFYKKTHLAKKISALGQVPPQRMKGRKAERHEYISVCSTLQKLNSSENHLQTSTKLLTK